MICILKEEERTHIERRACENGGRDWGALCKPRNANGWQPPEARRVAGNRFLSEPAEGTNPADN